MLSSSPKLPRFSFHGLRVGALIHEHFVHAGLKCHARRPDTIRFFIANREGRIIARIDGANTLRDGTGRIVAIYHATEDVTRNRTGRIVGKGNQMLRALGQKERRE